MISHKLAQQIHNQGPCYPTRVRLRSRKALRPRSWLTSVIAAPVFDLDLLSWIAPTAERHLIILEICSYMVRSRKTDQHVLRWAPK
jgi:hypothetical protein